jgi:hypothetical protein
MQKMNHDMQLSDSTNGRYKMLGSGPEYGIYPVVQLFWKNFYPTSFGIKAN